MEKLQDPINKKNQLVSIVIPVYNERKTIETIVGRVQKVEIPKELIIVDDGSTDGTREWLYEQFSQGDAEDKQSQKLICESRADCSQVLVLAHQHNQGKGAALKTGFGQVRGSIVIVQDADLEYSPEDYYRLLEPVLTGRADVVYGSRFLGGWKGSWPPVSYMGNKIFTTLTNAATGLSLTDVWTGYKVFKQEVLSDISLEESGFELELELTLKVAQKNWRVAEVPISYLPRSKADGKKIRWRDGIQSIKTLYRYSHPS
ncbi:glycosyltransferase family 2 protein [Candidatus Nitrospira neomarina]|uniref:Glycosyltransferase family 2 protein n=1 Tax=Candidatus Nitrospira neomarina TaxID=3020899 RepID=A0AA96GN95_9BACT|nr:glycosyltransferase family 2 protein [Candidatus Nitrospira neomarina]WNM60626.1 glycosyltransferase family 2 protein [Candidatus Nitrospira neomarina]